MLFTFIKFSFPCSNSQILIAGEREELVLLVFQDRNLNVQAGTVPGTWYQAAAM